MVNGFFDEFRFLSNFWLSEVMADGVRYRSVEHAYQAMKFTDQDERVQISLCESPGKAKRVSNKLTSFRPDWDEVRVDIMRGLVRQKFTNHSHLTEMLLLTAPHELEETNHWGDVFWGVCDGEGENWLGKILMEVRSELLLLKYSI